MALLFVLASVNFSSGSEDAGKILVILRKRVARLSDAALAKFVKRAGRAVKLRRTVNVLVTSSRELRALNRRFRNKDRPTDVLSFPAARGLAEHFAGEVAISADIASLNAKRLGHSPAEEIKILTLHGLLHLAGYDHERDHGEMARTEVRLQKALSLPVGLIERGQGLPGRIRKARARPARSPAHRVPVTRTVSRRARP